MKVGILRPITLFPFPSDELKRLANSVKGVLVVEMNAGQMVEDVRLAVGSNIPVNFYGRMGGMIPQPDEIVQKIKDLTKQVKI